MEGVGKMKEFINFNKLQFAIGEALKESVDEFVKEDIIPVTPKDTGLLRESIVTTKESDTEVIIYVENDDAGYGKYVHEMPPETNWTTQGTNNKFIERPLLTTGNKIYLNLANKVSKKGALTRSKFKVYKLGETNTSFFNTKTGNITKI